MIILLWCVHCTFVQYIKIFFFLSFSHLCALDCIIVWKILRFFLIWSFDIFPLDHMKNQNLFKEEKYQTSNQEKSGKSPLTLSPIYLYRTYDMIKCITFKNIFFKCLKFWTLYYTIMWRTFCCKRNNLKFLYYQWSLSLLRKKSNVTKLNLFSSQNSISWRFVKLYDIFKASA